MKSSEKIGSDIEQLKVIEELINQFILESNSDLNYKYSPEEKNSLLNLNKKIVLEVVKHIKVLKDNKLKSDKIFIDSGRLMRKSQYDTMFCKTRGYYVKHRDTIKSKINLLEEELIIMTTKFSSERLIDTPTRKSNSIWTIKNK